MRLFPVEVIEVDLVKIELANLGIFNFTWTQWFFRF